MPRATKAVVRSFVACVISELFGSVAITLLRPVLWCDSDRAGVTCQAETAGECNPDPYRYDYARG